MLTLEELERRLAEARERLTRAGAAIAGKHKGGEMEEYSAAHQALLRAERELASARGDEYAEPIDFPVKWSAGAPMPHLMMSDTRALLAFLVREPDPDWDGHPRVKDPAGSELEPLAVVQFERCVAAKFGSPNDEVFEGHPLHGKGMEAYRAQRVVSSSWLSEIEKINSVHRGYDAQYWRELTHFVFWFHDSSFECIARSYLVDVERTTMKNLLQRMVARLLA